MAVAVGVSDIWQVTPDSFFLSSVFLGIFCIAANIHTRQEIQCLLDANKERKKVITAKHKLYCIPFIRNNSKNSLVTFLDC